jgi:hypothetical protein
VLARTAPNNALDGHVEGRIGNCHMRSLFAEETNVRFARASIAAEQSMLSHLPEIASARYSRPIAIGVNFVGRVGRLIFKVCDDSIDLWRIKSSD